MSLLGIVTILLPQAGVFISLLSENAGVLVKDALLQLQKATEEAPSRAGRCCWLCTEPWPCSPILYHLPPSSRS